MKSADNTKTILYGINPISDLLKLKASEILKVFISQLAGSQRLKELTQLAVAKNISIIQTDKIELNRLAFNGNHQGVCAEVKAYKYARLDDVLQKTGDKKQSTIVILDGITDVGNFGNIIRTCAAAGVDLIIIGRNNSVGVEPDVERYSSGNSRFVSISEVVNISRTVSLLKEKNYWVYGADMGGSDIYKTDIAGRTALIFGSEGKGIRANVIKQCDGLISLPMNGMAESLNVASSAAAIIYEQFRQSREKS